MPSHVSGVAPNAISFHEASTGFADPLAMLMHDPDHSVGEKRCLVLGASSAERLLVVSHAERGGGRAVP